MRKPAFITTFFVGGALAALAAAQAGNAFQSYAAALFGAQSVSASLVSTAVGGASETISIDMQKPNKLRIDRPGQLIVADGKEIVTLDRNANKFFRKPQTDADLKGLLGEDVLNLWAPFFDANAVKPGAVKNLGPRNRGGQSLNGVEVTMGPRTVTMFLGGDNLPRQAQLDLAQPNGKQTTVVNVRNLTVGQTSADAFAFKAPSDAKEVSLAEMNAAKWFTNLEEAKKVAAATNRLIFVDFFATWCGPCKKLDAEVLSQDRFKGLADKLVFLRIDVDQQKNVAAAYKIEAMPTQMVLRADGSILSTQVGYGNPQQFFSWLMPNLR